MPEYQDIYDIHRNLTGKKVIRGGKRLEGEYILVIHVLLFDQQGRFLVQKRVEDKANWSGMWDISVGGIAQTGDTSRSASEREVMEELGIKIDLSDTEPVFTYRTGNRFDDYWFAVIDSNQKLTLQPEEVEIVIVSFRIYSNGYYLIYSNIISPVQGFIPLEVPNKFKVQFLTWTGF